MDRYVDPLVSHLKTMLNYRKLRKGTKAEVEELLMIEKSTSSWPEKSLGITVERTSSVKIAGRCCWLLFKMDLCFSKLFLAGGISEPICSHARACALRKICEDAPAVIQETSS
ncbi:unnamed protein product [Eruca vesicaria subsp. sativa]|uniref:Uncharacterized protein n=1 Tax=Eruca vesicaria subsp. sativa TaxID=29727 RepID=A0ABC8L2X5_ERUVS|nr:unnamed protein product [Eruca vesicaria subsp. sativa]